MNRQERRKLQRQNGYRPMASISLRRSCSQCGAPIEWIDNDQLNDVIGAGPLAELLQFMPEHVGLVALVRGDFWRCRRAACAEIGVILPAGVA